MHRNKQGGVEMEALLHVNHLEKNLDEFVLKDVNLTLQPGYIMGLIGVNGTGKTTLIQTILNLYKKDAGDVYVNGYSMEEQEREAKDQIGFVLDKNVFEELENCRQDIRCGFSLHLHFLMMRNFLFWMSLHQDWTHYFEKN